MSNPTNNVLVKKNIIDNETTLLSLKLPYDYPKVSDSNAGRKSIVNFSFDEQINRYLTSQDCDHAGKFMITAFTALLFRYTGQAIIPLTLSIYELDINHIVGQVQTAGNLSFEELFEQISDNIIDGNNKGPSTNQVQIVIRNKKNKASNGGNYHSGREHFRREAHQHDLHLEIFNDGNTYLYSLLYNGNLFDRKTIQRIGRHYQNLVSSVIHKGPKVAISDVDLFSSDETVWYDEIRTGGAFDFPTMPLHQDIERFAAEQPDKIAVTYKDHSITYGQLNVKANQLAHFLSEGKGMGANSRVIICVEPSVDIAVALLATMKIGATYVPLNPSHPDFRIQTILQDTKPSMAIVHHAIIEIHDFRDIPVLILDDFEKLGDQPQINPDINVLPDQTAYIYYTSGTTGVPKGSLGTYANLNHYIRVSQERYGFNGSDIMPALASYTFSISMFELLSPLVAGGTLKVMDREQILDVEKMVQMFQEVTFVHAGPSILKTLVRYINRNIDDYSVFNSLRHLSSGGDMVPPDLLRKLQLIFPHTELYVIYGCSEIGCMGATYPIDPVRPVEKSLVGKPFKNVSIVVLDKDANPVPIGVAGEVCIGGNGVAAGYLGNRELTSEKFFQQQGIRFYRTGDIGRLNEHGDLELLGREDFQIQIHGMRVELGEVEYHLRQSPAIRDAVVISKKHGSVENALVAFYLKKDNYQVHSEALRQHMMQHVPDYMVPSYYVELEALPLNVNMKVDRKALQTQDIQIGDPIIDPQSQSEIELAAIWSGLLENDKIGLHDNFLAIGGDSLLAMEMINKVHESMGVKLDGLSILRESLQVLAAICDSQLNRTIEPAKHGNSDYNKERIDPIKSFFYGPESSLYGLFHHREGLENKRAVLICAPIGSAYKRCYYLLKLLGDELSMAGIPVMRFDYFGTNDSLGEDREATIDRWVSDITYGYQELQRRTRAKVMVLGIRLGALLALKSLSKLDVERWVLWDPVVDGESYYQELLGMQKNKIWRVRTIRGFSKPKADPDTEELIGFTYSKHSIKQLKNLSLKSLEVNEGNQSKAIRNLFTNGAVKSQEREDWSKLFNSENIDVNLNCRWVNPLEINTAIIDKQIINQIFRSFIEESV